MRAALLPLAASLLVTSTAYARATFIIENVDPPGTGLNDLTPVVPVGGNTGTTLGEQRLIALQYAADIWAEVIDSAVPIVVQVSFKGLTCDQNGAAELGQSNAYGAVANLDVPGADPDYYYCAALANRLLGRDAFENEPDIVAEFNADLDSPDCLPGTNWYYGLDANPGNDADLVTNALHELGHGLCIAHFVDMLTGELPDGRGDPYAAHVFDIGAGKGWLQMTDAERVASAANPRRVVWDGASVTAQAPGVLDRGAPVLSVTPEPPELAGFSALVSEANFGAALTAQGVQAELVLGSPRNGCNALDEATGRVVLLFGGTCNYGRMAVRAQQAGAVAVLIAYQAAWQSPPAGLEASRRDIEILGLDAVTIPALSITVADAELLEMALGQGRLEVQLRSNTEVLVGADGSGRVFLNATDPVLESSSISHWDSLARPNLLMEPAGRPENAHHQVDLTVAMLRDLGWFPRCGNGQLDPGEQCDDGLQNSDSVADACRLWCLDPWCGDGVVDTGEQCDRGEDNSDNEPGGCRTDCSQSPMDGSGGTAGGAGGIGGSGASGASGAGDGGAGSGEGGGTAGAAAAGGGTAAGGETAAGGGTAAGGTVAPDGGGGRREVSTAGGGCGCRATGAEGRGTAMPPGLVALLVLLMSVRRRNRRTSLHSNRSNRSHGGSIHE